MSGNKDRKPVFISRWPAAKFDNGVQYIRFAFMLRHKSGSRTTMLILVCGYVREN